MSDKKSSNTGSKGTPAIDRTKSGRVASGLKAAKKTIIGISGELVEEVAKAKHFQSLLKTSAFFANNTCAFTTRTGDLTNELHPVFRRANFADASHHELLIPTLRLATRLLGHASVRRLMRTIVDHRPTSIGELDDQRKPLHKYPDDGRELLTRQQEVRVNEALAELADMARFVDDDKLAKGHGTTEVDEIRGSNTKATHLTGVCSTTKYSRKNLLFLKIILNGAREKYDPPLVMAWQFQLALELVHEVCHALFIARCGNSPEGDTDIFFRNDALAEVGFAMEDRLLGGHLSLLYDQDKVYDKGHVSCHMKADGKPSRFIGIMVLWDWPCVAVKNQYYHHGLALWARKSGPQMTKTKDIGWRIPLSWLEPFFTTAFWELTEPDLHFRRETGRAFKADKEGQRDFASLTEKEKRELLPVGYRVREANGDIYQAEQLQHFDGTGPPFAMDFVPILERSSSNIRSAFAGKAGGGPFFRDMFTTTTWLAMGALAQAALILIAGRVAMLPALAYIVFHSANTGLQIQGITKNPKMDGVIMKKVSAQLPDSTGNFGSKAAARDLVVFHIGTRCNHPLGLLGPGFKEMGEMFTQMVKDLEEHKSEFGFFGATSWLNSSARGTSNETLVVCYFDTNEGLQRFAHSKYHQNAWNWWNKNYKSHPHLSIYHETFQVPKSGWETIYINSHPSGLGSATVPIKDEETGEEVYASTLVDASKGVLRTSLGRMAKSLKADEHKDLQYDAPY
ncbi:hypothetical protein B0A48_05110 [Cryoendolithus antarcticus]|uniref:Uncharacterized protein n=1 Tax=Cryoendolithus antarcticus TaxID=1507870 RepID=A0A1V8TE86_9PEZI|nr:hypothetical protein B0A48_05110 [Cryoendolithus antarcticus]